MVKDALDLLIEGTIVKIDMYNGNPIGLELPAQVELVVTYTEPGVRGDTASGSVTKPAKLETGAEVRVPFYIKEGEKIKVATETREFAGRPEKTAPTYSTRKACIGSSFAARTAGSHTAASATISNRIGMVMNAIGSQDFTPNRKLEMRRVSPNAAATPTTTPIKAIACLAGLLVCECRHGPRPMPCGCLTPACAACTE